MQDPKDNFDLFYIEKFLPHPLYGVADTFSNDYMLLFLNGSSATTPIKINGDSNVPQGGDNVTVVGLGITSEGFFSYTFPTVLQAATFSVVPNSICSRATDGFESYQGLIDKYSLCIANPGKSYCSGDSGGPVFLQGQSPAEDIQVGIVSWYVQIPFS